MGNQSKMVCLYLETFILAPMFDCYNKTMNSQEPMNGGILSYFYTVAILIDATIIWSLTLNIHFPQLDSYVPSYCIRCFPPQIFRAFELWKMLAVIPPVD